MTTEEVIVWPSHKHQTQIVQGMQRFYSSKTMCDVTLKAGDCSVDAHRLVLAAVSPYFFAMFSGRWSEKQENEITLHGLTPAGLKAVVEYAYHGKITVAYDNAADIIASVKHCQIDIADKICEDFLAKHIDESNFNDLLQLADLFELRVLTPKLVDFAAKFLMPRSVSGDSSSCTFLKQVDLLKSSFLEEVLKKWDFMSAGFGQVGAYEMIFSVVQASAELEPSLTELLLAVSRVKPAPDVNEILRYCQQKSADEVVEAGSTATRFVSMIEHVEENRMEQKSTFSFVAYNCDPGHQSVNRLPPFPMKDAEVAVAGIAVLDNHLYVVGGKRKEVGALTCCYKYDPFQDRWLAIESMLGPRHFCPAVAWNGQLVVFGGLKGPHVFLDTVEVYDPPSNTWTNGLSPLPAPVACTAAATYRDSILLTGGVSAHNAPHHSKQFLVYQKGQNSWVEKEPMICGRAEHASTLHRGRLYQFGGHHPAENRHSMPLVEYYDLTEESAGAWTAISLTADLNGPSVEGCSLGGFMHFIASEPHVKIFRFEEDYHQREMIFDSEIHTSKSVGLWFPLEFPEFVFKHLPPTSLKARRNVQKPSSSAASLLLQQFRPSRSVFRINKN